MASARPENLKSFDWLMSVDVAMVWLMFGVQELLRYSSKSAKAILLLFVSSCWAITGPTLQWWPQFLGIFLRVTAPLVTLKDPSSCPFLRLASGLCGQSVGLHDSWMFFENACSMILMPCFTYHIYIYISICFISVRKCITVVGFQACRCQARNIDAEVEEMSYLQGCGISPTEMAAVKPATMVGHVSQFVGRLGRTSSHTTKTVRKHERSLEYNCLDLPCTHEMVFCTWVFSTFTMFDGIWRAYCRSIVDVHDCTRHSVPVDGITGGLPVDRLRVWDSSSFTWRWRVWDQSLTSLSHIGLSINGGIPKMVGLWWKLLLKWMI